jgi:hypothetical protein
MLMDRCRRKQGSALEEVAGAIDTRRLFENAVHTLISTVKHRYRRRKKWKSITCPGVNF